MSLDPRARPAMVSPRLRELHDHWLGMRAGRHMPSRADFDPVDVPRLLPHLLLFDVEPGTDRLKVRVAGTLVVEMYGGDYTGRYFDEIDFGDRRTAVLQGYSVCLRTRQPYISEQTYWTPLKIARRVERLILPLSDDDATVTHILTGLEFKPSE